MTINKFDNLPPYNFIKTHLIRTLKDNAMPLVCIKLGNPKEGGWTPIPLTQTTDLPDNANLYICISSCNPLYDPSSKFHNTYRATIECASQTHMFMLDDIEDLSSLPLEPSWIIETSKNNFQALYVLEEPLNDIALANNITKALPNKANTDPSSTNAVRWARLPGGINGKKGKNKFSVRIKEANPELLYTPEHIINAFQLDIQTPTNKEPSAPIIGVAPAGWERYVSALLSIPADCDYNTWFNCMIAMHAWEEKGYAAIEEWSRTSTNPAHQKLTNNELRTKYDSIKYDSRNTKGHQSVIGWPWLQATAIAHGWSYENYSEQRLEELSDMLIAANSKKKIKKIINEVRDSYLTGADLEAIAKRVQIKYKGAGVDYTIPAVRKLLTDPVNLSPKDDTWTYHLTDKGNLKRFTHLYNEILWYIPEIKEFIYWDDNRWNFVSNIQNLVINTIEQIPLLENRTLTPDQEKQLVKWANTCESVTHIRALESLVRQKWEISKSISQLNTNKTIIGTPAYLLNLETGIPATNTPEQFITMQTSVDPTPDAKCPRWEKFILEIMNGNQELANFLQRLAGYALYGGNPEQLFIILEGHGANGKTTFVNVLQHILGDYAATAAADTLTRPAFNKSGSAAAPDIVRLYRKRLVICNEWNEGTYINESLIKVLSGGGDEISVRALYSNKTIDYVPEFIIFLATNHRPNIAGMDYGLWRRLLIIPFEVNFTDPEHIAERDPHLERYLKDNESQGILNWLIEGYQQWDEQGIGTSIETGIPAKLIELKQQYQLEMDSIGQFLQEQTENVNDNDELECIEFKTKSSDLHRTYKNWAADNGYTPKGSKTFSQALTHRGFKQTRIGTVRGFKGLRLLTPSELLNAEPRTIEGVTDDQAPTTIN